MIDNQKRNKVFTYDWSHGFHKWFWFLRKTGPILFIAGVDVHGRLEAVNFWCFFRKEILWEAWREFQEISSDHKLPLNRESLRN